MIQRRMKNTLNTLRLRDLNGKLIDHQMNPVLTKRKEERWSNYEDNRKESKDLNPSRQKTSI